MWLVEDDASVPEELLCDYFEGIDDECTYGEIPDDDCPFVDLMHALNDLQFLDDQLRSFRWNLGQCIPNITLSSNEFSLLRKQRKIESLIIHTDVYCDDGVGSVDLVQFPDLRSLSWKGLNKYSDFECLKDCIRAHGNRLVSLTLDLVDWYRAKDIWTDGFRRQSDEAMPDNFLVQRIMNPEAEDEKVILQSLEYLDLSAISFENADIDMPVLFNTENLRTLKLRKCIGPLKWLELVSSSGKMTELKSFELVLTNSGPINTMKAICNFIERAPKLEILCLMLRRPINWESLISTICRCSSLTRLVMHSLADEGNQVLGGEGMPWPSGLERLLQDKQLACFGSSTPPGELASQLQVLQARPLCKLLHIRATGEAMLNMYYLNICHSSYQPFAIDKFAEWAFSADGLPKLTVLAWGDFSHEGHYSEYNVLLCRSETGYRRLNPSDISLWDLVNDNMDMLAACPFAELTDLLSDDYI
ncbi:hypothetical protein AnigIFM63604_006985 [Aspergillus niger]|uniref:FAD dependent oxidoreductase family protein n=1 Tax=Aspergillus niger TaxID=5061 RepID=A0A505HZD5_ASPNG|nr:FAD dependent oxidoreductase family protein [Aspergillus niger]GLA50683.1 hypothetical protein AnigIFM63604_006985 [Aspergillus niger]